jgi:predicted HAD superfamily hydrolase
MHKVDLVSISTCDKPMIYTNLSRYEQLIYDNKELPLQFREQLTKVCRLTRLQSQETIPHKQVIWETTATAIAPMLFGFVHWCLEEAQAKGLEKLYFAARDGQILQKIAQVICNNWGYKIECRYLYGSRQAWHLPAVEEIGEVELDWILARTHFLSIRSICKRVNIFPEQIQEVLNDYHFPATKWDVNLLQHEQDVLQKIFTHKQVTELIVSTAASYREKVIGYFYQEGLGDGVPFGFVDVGWVGRIQRSFSRLLNIAGLYPESGANGFYFALEQRVKPFKNDKLLAYFYDVEKPCDRNLIFKYRHLFELFVSADHGSTISYEQQGNEYIPILRSPKNEKAINWGLYTLQEAAVEFAEQMTDHLGKQDFRAEEFLKAADILAKELVHHPSPQEAKAFGTFAISGDQTESMMCELAPVYKIIDWWRFLISGKHPHADVWHPGSIARSNLIVRVLLGPRTINNIRKIRKNLVKQKHTNLSKQFSQPI